jgi:hypothetical protein
MRKGAGMVARDHRHLGPSSASGPVASSSDLVALFDQLRAAITAYVGLLRAEGLRLDEVLPAVQRLVRQAEGDEPSPDELGVLMSEVVRWSVEAYQGTPQGQASPGLS